MVVSGWTAVGEFHYLHHGPDGSPYGAPSSGSRSSVRTTAAGDWPEHAMELALARAPRRPPGSGWSCWTPATCAADWTPPASLLPLNPTQSRFSDGDAAGWLKRLASLRAALEEDAGCRAATPDW